MRRITDVPELLDGPIDDIDVLMGNLRDLERINRWLGGVRLSAQAVDRLGPAHDGRVLRILDVGTGAADIPVALLDRAARRSRAVVVTGLDSRPEVLEAARLRRPGLRSVAGVTLEVGDGRSLPYPDDSFDVVHASLVAHHLSPAEVVALLCEMARVASLGIVVNDLARGRLGWIGAWLLVHVATRNRYTRHDAPLSVRRAYSRTEMADLFSEAGLAVAARIDGFAGHRSAWIASTSEIGAGPM